QPPDAEREIEPERAGGHDLDIPRRDGVSEPHHRALAELLLDLAQRCGKGLLAVLVHSIFLQECEWSAAPGRRRKTGGLFHRSRGGCSRRLSANRGDSSVPITTPRVHNGHCRTG